MHFEFSEDQVRLREQARRLFEEFGASTALRRVLEGEEPYSRALWARMGDLGFLGAALPEEHGGAGAGFLELCVVAEEAGRALASVPFLSSIGIVAPLILAHGDAAQKARFLPRLATGEQVGCLALAEGSGRVSPRGVAARVENGLLTGTKAPVLDGDVAHVAIVAAQGEGSCGLYIVELDAAQVSRSALATIDPTRGQARIELRGVPAERLGRAGWADLEATLDRAAVLAAFEQVGGAERALEMARGYALERHAFGRPIGSFQAIKHKLVDMYVATVLARSNSYYGAWSAAHGAADLGEAAAAARVSATRAYQLCAKENIQVHGGMGFTWALDCHLHYRRAHQLALCLGGLAEWQDRLIGQMVERRTAGDCDGF